MLSLINVRFGSMFSCQVSGLYFLSCFGRKKNAEEDERKRMDSIWRLQQDIAGRAMELNAVEEAAIRMEQDQDRHATIAQQILEERERRSQSERNRFGSTSKEFFNKFGTSCR